MLGHQKMAAKSAKFTVLIVSLHKDISVRQSNTHHRGASERHLSLSLHYSKKHVTIILTGIIRGTFH